MSLDRATADLAVLCLAPKDTQLAALADLLRQAVRKQLQAMEACMLAQGRMCDLRALHFQPPGWAHPITLIYPWPAGSGKVYPPHLLYSALTLQMLCFPHVTTHTRW